MIDIEPQVFTKVSADLLASYPNMLIVGRTIYEPPSFPCVCIEQIDASAVTDTRTSTSNENHILAAYSVNVYSKKENTAKSEAKAIMAIVDSTMNGLGFTLLGCVPVVMDDATKYRLSARYSAVVGTDETIYRS